MKVRDKAVYEAEEAQGLARVTLVGGQAERVDKGDTVLKNARGQVVRVLRRPAKVTDEYEVVTVIDGAAAEDPAEDPEVAKLLAEVGKDSDGSSSPSSSE